MNMKLVDWLAPVVTGAVCAAAGKVMFLGLGHHLEAEWPFPFSLLQYIGYGMIPVGLIGVLFVGMISGKWPWRTKPTTTTD